MSNSISGITKPSTQLHPAPSTSTQLHPAPCTSTQLISTSSQLPPPPPSSFQSPPSSLQHPLQHLNQNIARNWPISPNLGQKTKTCPFLLKIGTHGMLEVLIPHPDLDFWNSDPKIHFWANLGPKIQSFVWKLVLIYHKDADSKFRLRVLKFWPQNPFLVKFGPKKSKLSVLSENWYTWYLKDADSYSNISFLNFKS